MNTETATAPAAETFQADCYILPRRSFDSYIPCKIVRRTTTTIVVVTNKGSERTFTIPKHGDRLVERVAAPSYDKDQLSLDVAGCERRDAERKADRARFHRAHDIQRKLSEATQRGYFTWNGSTSIDEEKLAKWEALLAEMIPSAK